MKILVVGSEESLKNITYEGQNEIIPFPVLGFKKLIDEYKFERDCDWILFTSRQGVDFFVNLVKDFDFSKMKIAAIGKQTEKKLEKYGLKSDFKPKRYSSEDFVKEFPDVCKVKKGVFYPASKLADNFIEEEMKKKSIHIERVNFYTTECLNDNKLPEFEGVVFSSPSAVDCFLNQFGVNVLLNSKIVSIGTKTQRHLGKLNIESDVPSQFTMQDAVDLFYKL